MAEKHKSKYKKPENKKYTARKDLKDYTMDDKKGGMNPKSTGEKQLGVLRKRDKEMVDTGNIDVKYDADDRLYAKIEDGDYDPKTAAKRLKKRSEREEKDTKDALKDKIENLTREHREYLVREYVRRKIQKILNEQATPPPADEPPADTGAAPPPADAAAPPPADAAAPPPADAAAPPPAAGGSTPPADAAATPPADTGAPPPPAGGDTPKDGGDEKEADTDADKEADPETKDALDTDPFVKSLKKMPDTLEKIKSFAKVIKLVTSEMNYGDTKNFFQMLRTYAINKLERLGSDKKSKK
jgi:hypothetical protein